MVSSLVGMLLIGRRKKEVRRRRREAKLMGSLGQVAVIVVVIANVRDREEIVY